MAYIPTLADTPKPRSLPANYIPTQADTPIPQHHNPLYNFGAGFLNPFINALNLLPEGVTAGMHALGAKHFQDPLIKTFPSEGGLAYDIGNVGGFAVPFGDIAKGVEGVTAAARAIPGVGRSLEALGRVPGGTLAGRVAQTAAAGGLTGAATTSPTTGRETGAIGGTIGAGVGGLGSEVLGRLAAPFSMKGKKIAAAAIQPLHRFFNESIGRIMDKPSGETLKDAYTGIKKKVDWDSLNPLAKRASQGTVIKDEVYQNELKKVMQEAADEAKTDPDVTTGLSSRLLKLARPIGDYSDAIKLKKNINNLANWDVSGRQTENRLARLYSGRLGNALDQTIDANAERLTPGGANQQAINDFANEWRNQRNIYGGLQQFYTDPVTGKFSQPIKNELEAGNYEKAVKRFVPGSQEAGDKLNKFSNLIGNRQMGEKAILQKALEPYTDKENNINTSRLAAAINQKRLSPVLGQLFNEPEKRALSQIINSELISKDLMRHPGMLTRLSRHPFFTAGALGTMAHVGRLPLEMAAAVGGAGFVGPQMVQERLMSAAERKAADLIERGEWDKLKGLGQSIKRESLPTKKFFPSLTGGIGRQVAAGGQPP